MSVLRAQRRRLVGPAAIVALATILAACGAGMPTSVASASTPAATQSPSTSATATAATPAAATAASTAKATAKVPGSPAAGSAVSSSSAVSAASTARPLAGLTIALDPGHNLGNSTHPRQISKRVWVGFWKECNTTGTATNSGYPEATFAWDVSLRVKRELERLGARVVMTRNANTTSAWGPCVDYRGRFGKTQKAALKVSIHADGARSSGHGFHVIEPAYFRGYTSDIVKPSARLGAAMKTGLIAGGIGPSNYIRGAISVRKDLGTLNMSDIPTVITELGNMRNSHDAGLMKSSVGRQRYANGVVRGIRLYLKR